MRGGVLLFANFLLASVGFSAWAIAESADARIKANADDIVDLNDIFDIQEPLMFQYGPYGIISDETFVSSGYIYFPVLIDTQGEDFDKLLSSDGTLSFDFEIVNKGSFALFDDSYLEKDSGGSFKAFYSVSASSFSDDYSSSVVCDVSNQAATASISIGNDGGLLGSEKVYCKIRLGFSFPDFEASVYPKLSSLGLDFSLNAKAVAA